MDIHSADDKDKFSYALAMDAAARFMQLPVELNRDILIDTFAMLLRGGKPEFSQQEYRDVLQKLQSILEEKGKAAAAKAGAENVEKGKAFREENAKKSGVVTTKSGLQYEILKDGSGPKPSATSTVKVHYEGKLIDGRIFDSSIRRGEPVEFPLNRVIPGWTEGVQLMNAGSKFRFVIPPELAYGEHGAGPLIGPHATLVFDVELLEFK